MRLGSFVALIFGGMSSSRSSSFGAGTSWPLLELELACSIEPRLIGSEFGIGSANPALSLLQCFTTQPGKIRVLRQSTSSVLLALKCSLRQLLQLPCCCAPSDAVLTLPQGKQLEKDFFHQNMEEAHNLPRSAVLSTLTTRCFGAPASPGNSCWTNMEVQDEPVEDLKDDFPQHL